MKTKSMPYRQCFDLIRLISSTNPYSTILMFDKIGVHTIYIHTTKLKPIPQSFWPIQPKRLDRPGQLAGNSERARGI